MIKMTDEQKALFDKLTTLQQEVALNAVSGMSDIDCYRKSSGKAVSDSAQRASVSEILANHNVSSFINSVRSVVIEKALCTTEDIVRRLLIESEYVGEGASHAARISALKALSNYTGGFDANTKKIEISAGEELTPWGAIAIEIDD